jgi:2-polyprenyl-3-methyl-5-hydroxy-6-metoxy-1,4-benzoquinol methylase
MEPQENDKRHVGGSAPGERAHARERTDHDLEPARRQIWFKRWMVALKVFIKLLYGGMYRLALPILVRPPGSRYRGEVNTFVRIGIMKFLESWQTRIHGKVLDVGVGTWRYPRQLFQNRCEYTATDCFTHSNVDVQSNIHSLTEVFSPGTFDFVICTDVMEHVPHPWKAVKELHAVLKPGGTMLLTTPFNFHLHGSEKTPDYWRMSADALRVLLIDVAGFAQADIEPVGHPRYPFSYNVTAKKGES